MLNRRRSPLISTKTYTTPRKKTANLPAQRYFPSIILILFSGYKKVGSDSFWRKGLAAVLEGIKTPNNRHAWLRRCEFAIFIRLQPNVMLAQLFGFALGVIFTGHIV